MRARCIWGSYGFLLLIRFFPAWSWTRIVFPEVPIGVKIKSTNVRQVKSYSRYPSLYSSGTRNLLVVVVCREPQCGIRFALQKKSSFPITFVFVHFLQSHEKLHFPLHHICYSLHVFIAVCGNEALVVLHPSRRTPN